MANESPAASVPNVASLLGALQAVRNVRAVALTALVLVTTALVFGLVIFAVGRTGSVVLTVIGGLFAYLVAIYGVSAVGFMLMNDAKGAPPLSMADALTVSLMSTHRWIAVMLLALIVFILFAIVLAIILFVCKIPFVGPVLYTVVVPAATFITALFLASLYFVVMPLTFPSVWTGDTTMQVVSKLTAIARQRLIPVVVQVLLLMLLVFFVAGIIASLVFTAGAIVGAMSAGILGIGGGLGALSGMRGMGRMMGGMEGAAGYMIAGGIGYAIVITVVLIVPFLIMIQGYCLIYLDAIKGIDFSASEEALKAQMENLQRKAREAQERVREKTHAQVPPVAAPAISAAPPAPVAPPPPLAPVTAAPATHCPKCSGAISSADMFCGGCGYKLR